MCCEISDRDSGADKRRPHPRSSEPAAAGARTADRRRPCHSARHVVGGVRRHLDALLAQGRVDERESPARANRGRGRPARRYALSEQGRAGLPHAYDDLALAALRHIAASEGAEAVARFTAERVAGLEERCRDAMDTAAADGPEHPLARAEALAEALTREGYAASASAIAAGGNCASTIARWPTSPLSSLSCARPRPR
ncbi:MAG: hypothetical protein WKF47_06865 [Geodermatophilaceae bacterium]